MSASIEIQQAINKRPRVIAKRKRCLSLPAGDLFCREGHPNIKAIEDIKRNEVNTKNATNSYFVHNLSAGETRKVSASISYGQLIRDVIKEETPSECGQENKFISRFNS